MNLEFYIISGGLLIIITFAIISAYLLGRSDSKSECKELKEKIKLLEESPEVKEHYNMNITLEKEE